jgi:hypothetical protein
MTEQEAMENPLTNKLVETDNLLKQMLVEYVGKKHATEKDDGVFDVTVKMITDTLADEFPEFVLLMAEENWVRGYKQGLDDAKLPKEQTEQNK